MTDTVKTGASDIPASHWIDRLAPRGLRPYLRLARIDRPIGTWLLLFPCWWGLALAAPAWSHWPLFALFAIGALIMRGAGCTLNDIVDRDFDARVARTATRPIPSGAVSVPRAFAFLAVLLLAGLAVLVQFNAFTIVLGVGSLAIVAVYPFMKRFTNWPQAVLGLAFNWGALLGWTAIKGEMNSPALLLFAAGILWILGYDTIYAHQDKEDDALLGLKSTALKLGKSTRPWLFGFYGATIVLTALAGHLAGLGWSFYAILALGAGQLFWQAAAVDIDAPGDCLAKFKSNRYFGWLVLAAMLSGQAL